MSETNSPPKPAEPEEGLGNKALKGVKWSAIDRIGQSLTRFGIQIVLARLLLPEDFGLLAMVLVFVSVAIGFTDFGLSAALIQKKEVNDDDLNTAFIMNVLLGLAFTAVLIVAAPWISEFYRQPALTELLYCVSFGVLIRSLSRVQVALLNRELAFRRLFYVTFPAAVLSGLIAIVLACLGYGVYALIAHYLLQALFELILLFAFGKWWPRFSFNRASFMSMFPYGSRLAVSGLISQVFAQIYTLAIGRVYAPADLGFYQRAESLKGLASGNLDFIIRRVTFPLFASIQDDVVRLKRGMLKSLELTALISFTAMALVGGLATPMIEFLIGEKWLDAAPYLELLWIAGAMYPIHSINISIIKAIGRADLHLRLEIIRKVFSLGVLFVTIQHSIMAVVWGQLALQGVAFGINTFYPRRLLKVQRREQLSVLMLPGLIAVGVFIIGFSCAHLLSLSPFFELLLGSTLAGLFALLLLIIFRRDLVFVGWNVMAKRLGIRSLPIS
ncbi:MAG: lipopolysaccharide biosynthesis protein [Opitutaceae bacterium]